jgi:Skp family chaperone for outer membrane proteins
MSMNTLPSEIERIKKDHQKKSNQVRKLHQKLKHKAKTTIPIDDVLKQLTQRLKQLKNEPIDAYDPIYYEELKHKQEGQISELQQTIWMIEDMRKNGR